MSVGKKASLHDLAAAMGDEQELTERRRFSTETKHLVAVWASGSQVLDVADRTRITIGRSHGCDLRIDDASVSRRHAVIDLSAMAVEDCASTNGTSVGGTRIPSGQNVTLSYDVPIAIGNAIVVLQRVHAADAMPTSAPRTKSIAPVTEVDDDGFEQRLALVAKSPLSVLIVGETGVGKEVATDRLHAMSERRGALVKINCAALPENLLEAELFGFERGAFTGAVAPKQGLVEAAEGGTLFLDEVGELPLATQAKLLRVLESREVQRIGALRARVVDVRFVAATNRNIESLVRSGRFRSDLYFRLNGMTIDIPPLRERLEELPELAEHFVEQMSEKLGRRPSAISNDAMERLRGHSWPGNLRELRNVIDRAILLAGHGRIEKSHVILGSSSLMSEDRAWESATGVTMTTLPEGTLPPLATPSQPPSDSAERRRILDALAQAGGNQTTAAKLLKMSRRTLVYKLGQFAIPRPRKKNDEP